MKIQTTAAAAPVLFASLVLLGWTATADARQPAAKSSSSQAADCELANRVYAVQAGSRKLVADVSALPAADAGAGLSKEWSQSLLGKARQVNATAEKLAGSPTNADPETLFNLGKNMNEVQAPLKAENIQRERARNAALDAVAKLSDTLHGDTAYVLMNIKQLKDINAGCIRKS